MFKINATIRLDRGKSASRRLRRSNQLPAIIYGGNEGPVAVELSHDELFNLQAKPQFYDEFLSILANEKKIKVKVQAVQRHPFKPKILHVDFIRV